MDLCNFSIEDVNIKKEKNSGEAVLDNHDVEMLLTGQRLSDFALLHSLQVRKTYFLKKIPTVKRKLEEEK